MSLKEYKQPEENLNILNDDGKDAYERLDTKRRKESILLSDTKKFRLFTKMMRIGMMLKNSKKSPLNP